jgi:hypothetical protein
VQSEWCHEGGRGDQDYKSRPLQMRACVRGATQRDFETCTTLYQDVRVSVGRRENRETDDKQPRTWWEMMSSETTAQRCLQETHTILVWQC